MCTNEHRRAGSSHTVAMCLVSWAMTFPMTTPLGKLVHVVSRSFRRVGLVAIILLASWPVAAADLGTYRDFKIGASTGDVAARSSTPERDLKTLHARPALLQELSWRPRYAIGRNPAEPDSVSQIVFSFIDNQLFRMAIDYDRSTTEGLTKDDMIASLSAIYGARSTRPPAASRPVFDSLDALTVLATWRQDDVTLTLNQSAYRGGFSLVITSIPLETLARKAQAAAVVIDTREAPVREAARAKEQADAAQAAAEKTRATNKATFKP